MKERSFDEMIAFFNRRVADMDISQDCKMELLGMVTALGYKHEKSVPQWIPCSERLPDTTDFVLTINIVSQCGVYRFDGDCWLDYDGLFVNEGIRAWMPLPEPYKGENDES